jgi:uncharacterized protein (DUF433 family)
MHAERSGEGAIRFARITVDPRQMGGVPCVGGLRIPVATVVGMAADGMAEADNLRRLSRSSARRHP